MVDAKGDGMTEKKKKKPLKGVKTTNYDLRIHYFKKPRCISFQLTNGKGVSVIDGFLSFAKGVAAPGA